MSKRRTTGRTGAVLALASLIGLIMPIGDTAQSTAQATSLSVPDVSPPDSPVPKESIEPNAETGQLESVAGGIEETDAVNGEAVVAPAVPQDAPGQYGLTWKVVDETDTPIAGTTVRFEGPRSTSTSPNASWGSSRRVSDCTAAPCAETSMDQDPRPGVFAVDRLVAGSTVTPLGENATRQRFRITPERVPDGYRWVSSSQVAIPQLSLSQPWLPRPNPWASPTYDFGTLRVERAVLSCEADNIYSISGEGQLKHVKVDPGRTSGAVSVVGKPGPSSGDSSRYNGLAIGSDGSEVYAFNRQATESQVLSYDVAAETWGNTPAKIEVETKEISLIAGAMDPEDRYWVGGFVGRTGLDIWAMNDAKTEMVRRGRVDLSDWSSTNTNGDFAFDAEGNLFIVRGLSTGTALDIFRVDAEDLAAGRGTQLVPVSAKLPNAESPFRGVSGIAYDPRGALFVGGGYDIGFVTLPVTSAPPQLLNLRDVALETTDLATCAYPPTVKLEKELPDGRAAAGDQFRLELRSGSSSIGSTTTTGSASGVQPDSVGPIPVTSGVRITLSETPAGQTSLSNYASNWACVAEGETIASGSGTQGSVVIPEMPRGSEVLCTIKNTVKAAEKTAIPATGTAVEGSSIVRYELKLDNSAGEGPVDVDYWDVLTDVLDDAVFVDGAGNPTASGGPEVTATGGIVFNAAQDWNETEQWLRMRGQVPAGATGTLSFSVRVHPNSYDAEAREQAEAPEGYLLRNRLVAGTGGNTPPPLPEECAPGLCTEHPVNAWTVAKASVPADGATLSKGGNVHYRVTAEKLNASTPLNGLVLEDDLTQVFKTAGWAPDAVAPAGAQNRGVYLFNEAGRSIGLDGAPNTGSAGEVLPVQDVPEPTQRDVAEPGNDPEPRWIVTSGAPLRVPAEAVRAEMWFAVQSGESPASIPSPETWEGEGNTPVTGWQFVNYATGMAGTGGDAFAPNACVTGQDRPNTGLAPGAEQPRDTDFPERCAVQQQLTQNSFTIRKDAGGLGVSGLTGDPEWGTDASGLWNMVGHGFEIRDADGSGPSSYPSVALCRTDYDPAAGWNGDWIAPSLAADESRWDFVDRESATQRGILDWNNAHPEDTRPVCGTVSEIDSGAQQGRWRSEGLGSGDYWLVETRAPNAQINTQTLERRPVPGVQKLAEAVPFTVWDEQAGPEVGGGMQGLGQLDVGHSAGTLIDRCDPAAPVDGRPTACVDQSGYFMVVKDPAPVPLPLSGGEWLQRYAWLGGILLAGAIAAAAWWRRRVATEGNVAAESGAA